MTEYTGAWDAEGVASFLAETTVPLRVACRTPTDRPWIVSLWFVHRDGALHCATGADADLVRFLEHDRTVGVEVSTNEVPYRGVRGVGTAAIEPDEDKALLRSLLERYLGGTDSQLARGLLADDREEVAIRIEPERFHSWDFSDRMADVAEDG